MPRNGSGIYSLPQPPFTAGTVISSAAVNSNFSDIATALTGSLPVNGSAGMTGPLRAADGSTIAPSYTFSNEATTGFNRIGAGQLAVTVQGAQVGFFDANGWEGPVPLAGTVPLGLVSDYAGSTAPSKWLLCFGQAVNRVTYAALFAIIGTIYGVGDGSTTFNVPDGRGNVFAGRDDMGGTPSGRLTSTFFLASPTSLGAEGGGQSHALVLAEIPTNITSSGSMTGSSSGSITGTANSVILGGTSGGGGVGGGGAFGLTGNAGVTGSYSGSASVSGSITSNNTGGGAHTIVQPTLILNKIIYAGA